MDYVLRPFKIGDAASLSKYANNENVSKTLRDVFPYPYTVENAKTFIRRAAHDAMSCTLAIVIDGEAVGCVSVSFAGDIDSLSAEIGYWLGEPFWGQGIATDAVGKMCEYVFKHYDIVRIHASVFRYNRASRRVLEKNGFELEGILRKSVYKNGKICDSCVYSLVKEES